MDPFPPDDNSAGPWSELALGAPTIVGMARLCGDAVAGRVGDEPLSRESRALLFAARLRGVFEIKGAHVAFDSASRLLAVRVEVSPDEWLAFRSPDRPETTVRFLDGFRRLCAGGHILHHLGREFSLSQFGFEEARRINAEDVESLVTLGQSER